MTLKARTVDDICQNNVVKKIPLLHFHNLPNSKGTNIHFSFEKRVLINFKFHNVLSFSNIFFLMTLILFFDGTNDIFF